MADVNNYAIVDNTDTVVNIAAWDGLADWAPPAGTRAILFNGVVSIGYTYNGTTFNPPST